MTMLRGMRGWKCVTDTAVMNNNKTRWRMKEWLGARKKENLKVLKEEEGFKVK